MPNPEIKTTPRFSFVKVANRPLKYPNWCVRENDALSGPANAVRVSP